MIVQIVITIILLICSFLSKAVKDTVAHHFDVCIFKGIKDGYFDPRISWKNKYNDYPRDMNERFPGSTTIFVWMSDCWHLYDAIQALCWQICLAMWITIALPYPWYYGFGVFAGTKACTFAFHFPYTYWFIKKK